MIGETIGPRLGFLFLFVCGLRYCVVYPLAGTGVFFALFRSMRKRRRKKKKTNAPCQTRHPFPNKGKTGATPSSERQASRFITAGWLKHTALFSYSLTSYPHNPLTAPLTLHPPNNHSSPCRPHLVTVPDVLGSRFLSLPLSVDIDVAVVEDEERI